MLLKADPLISTPLACRDEPRDRQFNNIELEREVEKKTSHCVTRFQRVPREHEKKLAHCHQRHARHRASHNA